MAFGASCPKCCHLVMRDAAVPCICFLSDGVTGEAVSNRPGAGVTGGWDWQWGSCSSHLISRGVSTYVRDKSALNN